MTTGKIGRPRIRPANQNDFKPVGAMLDNEGLSWHGVPELNTLYGRQYFGHMLRKGKGMENVNDGKKIGFVAEINGKVVGAVLIDLLQGSRGEEIALIDRLVVSRNRRKIGIGTMLREHAEKICTENGSTEIRAEISVCNTDVLSMFGSAGYEILQARGILDGFTMLARKMMAQRNTMNIAMNAYGCTHGTPAVSNAASNNLQIQAGYTAVKPVDLVDCSKLHLHK
jgi:GNAT superfamily N-acetyltransferase